MLLSVQSVHEYKKDEALLFDVDLLLESAGQVVAIIGPNGGGKSTLLQIISGAQKPSQGCIQLKQGASILYLPQKNTPSSYVPCTTKDYLFMPSKRRKEHKDYQQKIIHAFMLESLYGKDIATLSSGEWQRVAISRFLLHKASLFLFDEPEQYLQSKFQKLFFELLMEKKKESSVLLVSHHLHHIQNYCDVALNLNRTITQASGANAALICPTCAKIYAQHTPLTSKSEVAVNS